MTRIRALFPTMLALVAAVGCTQPKNSPIKPDITLPLSKNIAAHPESTVGLVEYRSPLDSIEIPIDSADPAYLDDDCESQLDPIERIPDNAIGLLEHRGKIYCIEDLKDPAFLIQSDDPFIDQFGSNDNRVIPWAGMESRLGDWKPDSPDV